MQRGKNGNFFYIYTVNEVLCCYTRRDVLMEQGKIQPFVILYSLGCPTCVEGLKHFAVLL